jgi:sigma-B regulation protein RsbU (phosphoserine phosphatase)
LNPESTARSALARLRHDLRTPINHIIGYGELLEDEVEDAGHPELSGDLKKITSAARTLLELIGDNLSEAGFSNLIHDTGLSGAPAAPSPASTDAPKPRYAIPSAADEAVFDQPPAVTGRILAVDDNAENREMLARRLERQGHTTAQAPEGRSALEILRKEPFDLVLLDVMMPVMDGYTTLRELKSDPVLRHIPVIMISALDELDSVVRCIESGAEDYLPKPFNPTLLRARIGASLEKKALRDQEQQYIIKIEETQHRLSEELSEAANYVRSIIPPPLDEPFKIDWRYIPSTELGGDAFGYHWIDDDHFAAYLLDVCGHGVGASLLSVTAMNVIRSGSLARTDFRDPGQVLSALNDAFLMEKQNNMYFTIWYGVYHRPSRTLRHASGGHPPALLFTPAGDGRFDVRRLRCPGLLIGAMEGMEYNSESCEIAPDSRLVVLCDGTYELKHDDGRMVEFEEFEAFMADHGANDDGLDQLIGWARSIHGDGPLDDDFSIFRIRF